MNSIEIYNNYGTDIKELTKMEEFIKYCVDRLNLKNVVFSVIIINDEDIHKINKEYRGIDRPTDVISFALEDDKTIINSSIRMLGDIYISYDTAIRQAKEYNHSNERELCFLAVHGLLHLLGYDHMNSCDEKKMFDLQKELLDSYGIKKES